MHREVGANLTTFECTQPTPGDKHTHRCRHTTHVGRSNDAPACSTCQAWLGIQCSKNCHAHQPMIGDMYTQRQPRLAGCWACYCCSCAAQGNNCHVPHVSAASCSNGAHATGQVKGIVRPNNTQSIRQHTHSLTLVVHALHRHKQCSTLLACPVGACLSSTESQSMQ